MKKILISTIAFLFILSIQCFTDDIGVAIDKFYGGLARIIENNMNAPNKCVEEVSLYYAKNDRSVEKIRNLAEKNMEAAFAMKDQYGAVSTENPEALDLMAIQHGITSPTLSEGSKKYADALHSFILKYPTHGVKIAAESMKLLPGANVIDNRK